MNGLPLAFGVGVVAALLGRTRRGAGAMVPIGPILTDRPDDLNFGPFQRVEIGDLFLHSDAGFIGPLRYKLSTLGVPLDRLEAAARKRRCQGVQIRVDGFETSDIAAFFRSRGYHRRKSGTSFGYVYEKFFPKSPS